MMNMDWSGLEAELLSPRERLLRDEGITAEAIKEDSSIFSTFMREIVLPVITEQDGLSGQLEKPRTIKSPTRTIKSPTRTIKSPTRTIKSPTRTIKSPTRTTKSPARSTSLPTTQALAQIFYSSNPLVYGEFLCFYITAEKPILGYLYEYRSDVYWEREFELGKFKVFNYFIGQNYLLKPGDLLFYAQEGRHAEPEVNREIEVLYEDEELWVWNKPALLPCHPSGAYFYHSLTQIFEERGIYCHLIHRLDLETSGVLLGVKEASDVSAWSEALRKGEKTYHVLVHGSFPDELRVEFPLGTCSSEFVRKKQGRAETTGKPSLTLFSKCKEYSSQGQVYSLITAKPLTGRTHQIRAHLLDAGYPVVGDKIYGKDERYFLMFLREGLTPSLLAALELRRQFLHAERIQIQHPFTGAELTFETHFSKDLELNNFFQQRNWKIAGTRESDTLCEKS